MIVFSAIIVGAGPSGIATATELIRKGVSPERLLLLERSDQISNMIQSKYPAEKPVLANYKGKSANCIGELCIGDMSKEDFHSYLKETVKNKQIVIQFGQQVQKIVKLRNGQWYVLTPTVTYLTNSVFIAIGTMSAPRMLSARIDDESKALIHSDLQKITANFKRVLVVGGGDSASEYAQILSARGHEVLLSYRKETFKGMHQKNQVLLRTLIDAGKIHFYPNSLVTEISATNGTAIVSFDTTQTIAVDAIVTALGSEKPSAYLENLGITLTTEAGRSYVEEKRGGLFYVGDLAAGIRGGSINLAFDSATEAVSEACSLYLDCKSY